MLRADVIMRPPPIPPLRFAQAPSSAAAITDYYSYLSPRIDRMLSEMTAGESITWSALDLNRAVELPMSAKAKAHAQRRLDRASNVRRRKRRAELARRKKQS